MINDYPTVIVDNFFKYPLDIREFALQFKFSPSEVGRFSGVRTGSLHETHASFFRSVCKKILDCYSIQFTNYRAAMHFHLTGDEFGDNGWVHTDANGDLALGIASIIYLNTDNNNLTNGTGLYKLTNPDYSKDQAEDNINEMRKSYIEVKDNVDIKHKHNLNFEPTVMVGNMFNRMVAYDSRTPHAGLKYFGNDNISSRLTLLTFFYDIQTVNNLTPLQRAEARSDI
jgi:hypothetical protein